MAVWAQDEEQEATARRVLERAAASHPPLANVPVLPRAAWWVAEEYHQHFIAEEKCYPGSDDEADPWGASNGPGTGFGL